MEKANGVPEIIKKYITNYDGKYLVFCKDKKHLYDMKDVVVGWFREAGYDGKIFEYPYYSNSSVVKKNLENFENNKEEGLKLLFIIDKLNEGLHLEEVHGCILLRSTTSNIIYYQQIGRAIDAGSMEQRVILDLVSNFNSLKSFNFKKELDKKVQERRSGKFSDCSEEFKLDKFDVVDCVQECVDVFENIDKRVIGNFWTKEEDEIILSQYSKIGVGIVDLLTNRSKKSIYHRAERLGVAKKDEWTDKEIELLKKLYPKYSKNCFKMFDKSVNSIKLKVKELGLVSEKFWSNEDIELLKEKYPIMGSDCIIFFPNRKRKLIQEKARKLGISYNGKEKWTDKEITLLKETYLEFGTECAKFFPNRKKENVISRAYALGLKNDSIKRNQTSRYKYVYWNKKSNAWIVSMTINGKQKYIGIYKDEDEAGRVALEKAKEYGKI